MKHQERLPEKLPAHAPYALVPLSIAAETLAETPA